MHYITLDEAKAQCSVELADPNHDDRLTMLVGAAERAAAEFLNAPLSDYEDSPSTSPPSLPDDIKAGILMQVEFMFDRDERTADMLCKASENLLWPHRVGLGV